MKRILTDAQVDEGKKLYRDMLADDPRWAKRLASAVHVKKKLNLGASPAHRPASHHRSSTQRRALTERPPTNSVRIRQSRW